MRKENMRIKYFETEYMGNEKMSAMEKMQDMRDREYRAYKRAFRRRRAQQRKWLRAVTALCLVALLTLSYHAISTSAHTGEDEIAFKYYTNISVGYGESLWEIADKYIDFNYYQDKNDYIAEVCSINHLDDEGSVRAGQFLIVPYYSTEFK